MFKYIVYFLIAISLHAQNSDVISENANVIAAWAVHHDWTLASGTKVVSDENPLKRQIIVIDRSIVLTLQDSDFVKIALISSNKKSIVFMIDKAGEGGAFYDHIAYIIDNKSQSESAPQISEVMYAGFFDHNQFRDDDNKQKPDLYISKIENIDDFPNVLLLIGRRVELGKTIPYEWQIWNIESQKLVKSYPQKDTGPFVRPPKSEPQLQNQ